MDARVAIIITTMRSYISVNALFIFIIFYPLLRPARFERATTRLKGGCSTPELRAPLILKLYIFLKKLKIYNIKYTV